MSGQLTIRNLPHDVVQRLKQLGKDRGLSMNTTIVEILERAVDARARRAGLDRYVTWTDEDVAEFEEALADQRVIDAELWR